MTRLWREYGGQYLLAEASADPCRDRAHDIEESIEETIGILEGFQRNIPRIIDGSRARMKPAVRESGTTAIWGSGSKCIAFLHATGSHDHVDAIVDINPHRSGRYIPGVATPVSRADDIIEINPRRVVVMNEIYAREIASSCEALGVDPEFLVLGEPLPEFRPI